MTIIFYSMVQCKYCKDAEELLKNEISSGEIVKKNASESPKGMFRGYPSFLNTFNNLTHTGLISKEELYKKLLVTTTIQPIDINNDDEPVSSTRLSNEPENFCINISKNDISLSVISFIVNDDDGEYKLIYIDQYYSPKMLLATPVPNKVSLIDKSSIQCSDSNLYSTILKQNKDNFIPYFKDIISNDILKQSLLRLFPCTQECDWYNDLSILNTVKKQSKKFMSVKSCGKNGLYYCYNDINKCKKRDTFCEYKNKVMFYIILILIFLIFLLIYQQMY